MSGLDVTSPAPRVNFESLGQFIGKRVTIVGRVEGVEGSTLRLKTSDDSVVNVTMRNAVPQVRWRRRRWGGSLPCSTVADGSELASPPAAPCSAPTWRLRAW